MISIIVPVYNVIDYLDECLKSIDSQNFSDYEVIVVDDGSTDGCGEFLEKFYSGKEKFRIIHKENGGLMSAWMLGIQHSKGDYIGFVDSDDYIDPNMFEEMYSKAKLEDADIVMCNRNMVFENGNISVSKIDFIEPNNVYSGKEMADIYNRIFPSICDMHISNARWDKIYKRDILFSNIKYCKNLSRVFEDRYITPACMFTAKKFIYIDKNYYYYRQRNNSNHSMFKEELLSEIKKMSEIQKKMLIEKNIFKKYKKNWEEANIDYIRLFIRRNIMKKNFSIALKFSKELLSDFDYSTLIKKYKFKLLHGGKLDIIIYISSAFRFPFLLAICCCKK